MENISKVGKTITEMITEIDNAEEKKLGIKSREIAKEFNYPVCIILVADPKKEKYIRIRKTCAGLKAKECQETQMYFCPGMCHEIALSSGKEKEAKQPEDSKSMIGQYNQQNQDNTENNNN